MGHRYYKRDNRRERGRQWAKPAANQDGLSDDLASLIVEAICALARGLRVIVRGLWRLGFGRRKPPAPAPRSYAPPPPALPEAWHRQGRRRGGRRFPKAPPLPKALRCPALPPPSVPARSSAADAPVLPYKRRPRLMSRGERALWYPLYYAVRRRYRIFCKVRLGDLVTADDTGTQERHWFGKIKGYHVDFVICAPRTTRPLLAIELDDRSHRSQRRQERDQFKEQVLQAAGIPLCRIPVQQAYDPAELREIIDRLIATHPRYGKACG